MNKPFALVVVGGAMLAASLVGCSNKPSDEQLKQLNDLKAEVSSLDREVSAREADKAALLKSIAEKDAQLAQCAKDKAAVQQKLNANH